ncbi:MAG TPA: hypothetical protein VI248_27230 [Kineosporiaceae bacterium]
MSEATACGPLPLWPFQTAEQVRAWQVHRQTLGGDPQHRLDPASTALEFTRGALGLTAVDRVTSRKVAGDGCLVGVGWLGEGGVELTVGVLRLVRFGEGGASAPWAVAGTVDTAAFTRPAYGATVTAPLQVAGVIDGVDETLRVMVIGPGGRILGRAGPIGVGGSDQRWEAAVELAPAPSGSVLTVVVCTGGHLGDVEWFAVTGVRLA